jgi:PhnB protein
MPIEPYLFFNGRCEEAVEFYKMALGAEVLMLMRFKDSPEPHPPGLVPPGWENKIMHTSLRIGNTTVMASDGCSEGINFQGFSLSLSVANDAEAERVFTAFTDGGQVKMPLTKTFWSPCFGMVADRFGVGWMVTVAA